jgi:hypothetical protein
LLFKIQSAGMKIKINSASGSLAALLLITISITVVFIFQGCNGGKKDDALGIGEKGNLKGIVIPANANDIIKFAATEFQTYFKKITGKELQIKEFDGKITQ